MVYQRRPVVGGRSFAENYTDAFGARIDDPLDIRTTKRRAILLAREFCEHHIGDLFDQLVVVSVLHFNSIRRSGDLLER